MLTKRRGVIAVVALIGVSAGVLAAIGLWQRSVASPLALYGGDTVIGLDAAMVGTLELLDGCLVARGEGQSEGDPPFVPVLYDADASWEDGAVLYRGVRIEVGATVSLGGGFVQPKFAPPSAIPPGCEGLDRFYAGSVIPDPYGGEASEGQP